MSDSLVKHCTVSPTGHCCPHGSVQAPVNEKAYKDCDAVKRAEISRDGVTVEWCAMLCCWCGNDVWFNHGPLWHGRGQ